MPNTNIRNGNGQGNTLLFWANPERKKPIVTNTAHNRKYGSMRRKTLSSESMSPPSSPMKHSSSTTLRTGKSETKLDTKNPILDKIVMKLIVIMKRKKDESKIQISEQ
jgi:hypothetical protein